jgi:amyloid beta precursor protein binding protein 1
LSFYFRLWAATGQSALESSRVLLLTSTATSTSTLKNLVLPGIGHFTILGSELTRPEDVGNNFFLEVESVGKNKAEEAVRLVGELNEGVDGKADTRVSDAKFIVLPNFC